jgi:Rad and Gem related GTP binding protein 1
VQQVENSLSTYEPHACIIVYSIIQRSSLRCAEETLNYLWRENVTKDKAVIVVGNKADLARSRAITTAGNGFAPTRKKKSFAKHRHYFIQLHFHRG